MIKWSIDLPNLRMRSNKYVASLMPGSFQVCLVLCRTDTPELAIVACNLGEPRRLELAKSATAALQAHLASARMM
jgi:ribosomal protein S12 methylthiotransferase accessory factor YcaO